MDSGCNCRKTDCYVSFDGIDCDGKARRLMAHIDAPLAQPGRDNAFREQFRRKRQGRAGVVPDDLCLIRGNLNQIRDFLESWDDALSLAMRNELEAEYCQEKVTKYARKDDSLQRTTATLEFLTTTARASLIAANFPLLRSNFIRGGLRNHLLNNIRHINIRRTLLRWQLDNQLHCCQYHSQKTIQI